MEKWERRREVVLGVLALLFLAAYAWPILEPRLRGGAATACTITQGVVWVVFVVDYVLRLRAAPARARWVRGHLVELVLLVLPILRPLRLLVLLTLLRQINRGGTAGLRGRVGLYVGSGSLIVGLVAALAVLDVERYATGSTITSFGDAVWWACATMTTVGYGDVYPVTAEGRVIGVALMVAGIALLGTVTATVASYLVEAVADEDQAENQAAANSRQAARDEARQVTEQAEVAARAELLSELHALREEIRRLGGR